MGGGAVTVSEQITSAITNMVNVVSTNVFPMVTKEPFVYFLAIGIISGACGIFARLRHTVH